MDGNKDEAVRCVKIAKAAIALGDKQRALKFINIAKRLDSGLPLDALSAACEALDSSSHASSSREGIASGGNVNGAAFSPSSGLQNGDRIYSEEHVKVVREVKKHRDYYAVLGLEKSCSVEEIRKAYRKLSLKVHPDKNKVPGAEEAFKKVSKAFKCLSEEESRRQYDQTGLVDEFEYNQRHNVRRRRRHEHDFFDDNIDPNEIFRSFFYGSSQHNVYRNANVYRTREMGAQHRENANGGNFNMLALIQLLPVIAIVLLAYIPFSEPVYTLQKTCTHQIPRVIEKYGVEFYVKSHDFDEHFPEGSPDRADLEHQVIRDYKGLLSRYCHMELQRRQWARNYPTPHCEKLQSFNNIEVA